MNSPNFEYLKVICKKRVQNYLANIFIVCSSPDMLVFRQGTHYFTILLLRWSQMNAFTSRFSATTLNSARLEKVWLYDPVENPISVSILYALSEVFLQWWDPHVHMLFFDTKNLRLLLIYVDLRLYLFYLFRPVHFFFVSLVIWKFGASLCN